MKEVIDPANNFPAIEFSSIYDFKNFYLHRTIEMPNPRNPQNNKQISVADMWLRSKNRRAYEGIVFQPGGDKPRYYNMWHGFAVSPKQGDWSLMTNHIRRVICGGNEEIFQWVTAWLARIVKYPGGERPGTSIVLKGAQGTGKGIFADNYGSIFGNHYLHLMSSSQLAGRFNAHLKDKILVFCDEAFWGGDRTAEGILKGIVTEECLPIEYKGKDIITVQNHANVIIASNNDWVVPAGMEERRFCVLDISQEFMQDKGYFGAIAEQMQNGGKQAMLYDLLNFDISGVDLRTIPRTKALLDQILRSMSTVKKFWYEYLKDKNRLQMETKAGEDEYILTKKIYAAYTVFARENGERRPAAESMVGKELKEICPGMKRKRLSTGARDYVYLLPSYSDCRKMFESKVRIPIGWEE